MENRLVPLGVDQFAHPQFVEFAGESLECKQRSASIAVWIRQFAVTFLITVNGIAQSLEFVERRLELRVRQFISFDVVESSNFGDRCRAHVL
jgi:hypothetical protein